MRKVIAVLVFGGIVISGLSTSNATDVGGDVWGTWDSTGNPYNVISEVRVPPGSTLVIEPGVTVNFVVYCKFIVGASATLKAVGTVTDSILFTTSDTTNGWHGIRFYSSSDSCQLSYCRIEYGKAVGEEEDQYGGGVYCNNSSPTISNSIISNDSAYTGGGIYCDYNSDPIITLNTITNNNSLVRGIGIGCNNNSNPIIENNNISYNTAGLGGSAINCDISSAVITNNSITSNLSNGIMCWGSGTIIVNNIIMDNSTGIGCATNSGPTIIENNTIINNRNNGIGCYTNSNSTITYNTITNNSGSGIYIDSYAISTISGNTIKNNSTDRGGGIYCGGVSGSIINNNTISDNSASVSGGGIYFFHSVNPIINGNTINGNLANNGAGIYFNATDGSITNCTLSGNQATSNGGGIYCTASSPNISNLISGANSATNGNEIYYTNGSNLVVTYSDIQGGWPGEGNIDADPLFVGGDPYDYHLTVNSPCIDTGDPNSPKDPDSTRADMGAYYFDQSQSFYLEYNPDDFIFYLQVDSITTRTYNIISRDTVGYVLSVCDSSWVTFDPDYVELNAYDTVEITATFNSTSMQYATYLSDIYFISDAPGLEDDTINVEMTVVPPVNLTLEYNPDDFTLDIVQDSSVLRYFNLICSQNELLSAAYIKPLCESPLVTFEPDSINLDSGDTVEIAVTIEATGLDYETYMTEIYFESDNPDLDDVTIPVEMTVWPSVDINVEILNNVLQAGDTLSVNITVTNPTYFMTDSWIATAMRLPGGMFYGPVFGPYDFRLMPYGGVFGRIDHIVPPNPILGDFQYLVRVSPRINMATIMGQDSTGFTVVSSMTTPEKFDYLYTLDKCKWEIVYSEFDVINPERIAEDIKIIPTKTSLFESYPNPFNAATTISFDLIEDGDALLKIYNLTGQHVETLVDGYTPAGQHNITWDASTYSSGVYFYKLTTENQIFTKRMTLLK